MKKVKKSTIIGISIGLVLLIGIGCGISHFINHMNGTTKAQIEARQRANEAADKAAEELNAQGQWYNDMMSEPVTVINSEGETKTYTPQTATCINSYE